jgi:DNA-directed RNA polymerase subunit K/omega
VNILIKKAKHIRRYNYTTEQNLKPIEGALERFQESLVSYKEVAKRANNPDGA